MADFTYEIPDERAYFKAVVDIAKNDPAHNRINLYNIIKDGYCEISAGSSYSQKRWNAMATTVNFYIPQSQFSANSSNLPTLKTVLKSICSAVMPPSAGYDILNVNISPLLESDNDNLLNDVIETVNQTKLEILSDEIKEKGKEMSELYITLYCIENSLRDFIDKTLSNQLGDDYFSKITVPNDLQKGIATRQSEEKQNKWLPLRGDKELYYLDFIDLSKLILNNWEYFKKYFPSQGWISTKLEELYKVRCLIAHNSYAGSDEKDLVGLYYKQIVRQIANAT